MLLERRERGTVGEERSAAVTVARMGYNMGPLWGRSYEAL